MAAIETEIKFCVADKSALELRLLEAGFSEQTPRTFESNVLYDTADRQLRARREILRIRSYGSIWTLTHKRPPANESDQDRHKHRIETETTMADGEALESVFGFLGLTPVFRYEKWRSEWSDGNGHCVIDETPIGIYAELEGVPEWIDAVAGKIGITPADYLTLSYGRLFEQWRVAAGSNAVNLTFDDVAAVRSSTA